jgi:hypothetical protein
MALRLDLLQPVDNAGDVKGFQAACQAALRPDMVKCSQSDGVGSVMLSMLPRPGQQNELEWSRADPLAKRLKN